MPIISSAAPGVANATKTLKPALTPPDVGVEFNKLLPDSELFWIDKCGHAAMMEHPDAFNKIVFDWLTKREF